MKNSPLLNAFPIVAASYGRKFGVKVVIGGSNAYTDGNTIVIPNMNITSLEMKNAIWGFLTHEAAHVRLTDFDVRYVNEFKQSLLNILEDGRIEHAFMMAYPGTRGTLAATCRYVFSDDPEVPTDEGVAMHNFFLGWVRYHFLEQDGAEVLYATGEAGFKALFSEGAYIQAMALLPHLANCATTQDCKDLVEKLVNKIEEEEQKEQEKQQQPDQSDDQNDQSDDSAGENGQGDSDDQDDQSNDQGKDQDAKDGGDQNGDQSSQKNSSNQQGGDQSAMAKALDTDKSKLPGDYLDAFKKDIEAQKDTSGSVPNRLDVQPEPAFQKQVDQDSVARAKNASNQIRKQLMGLLQSKRRVHNTPKRTGRKLNTKALNRLQTGDTRIFLRHGEKQQINTAVHLLTDLSGSMYGEEEQVARDSALALAYALEPIPGVSTGVSYFGPGVVQKVLPQGAAIAQNLGRFNQSSGGCTPAAEAIWSGCFDLLSDDSPKKVVVLVTDGQPDNPKAVHHVIDLAKKSGIEFIGIGINNNAVERYIDHSIVINDVTDLTGTLFNEIKQSLLAA